MASILRVRTSLADLQAEYDTGNREPLEKLMRAWKGIKELPADDPNSFFVIGGYHGEPFRGPGESNPQWWGGYCQHGTVLFPAWHRAYLLRLEQALQSIPGCSDVTLPYWDECSDDSQNNGIPRALTDEHFELDGVVIENPLRSFIFPVEINDPVEQDFYTKPKGYETVRYPLSGLVGTAAAAAATQAHNAKFPSYEANVRTLNGNVIAWLTAPVTIPQTQGPPLTLGLVYSKFLKCLDAPNYTLFSNTTSAGAWNKANPGQIVMSLESPHNAVHLAVGGFDVPDFRASSIEGANGDMGENETAGLDPIFFFHHCFIDYVFWVWQRRNGYVDDFDIIAGDPGTIYVLGGAATPPAGADPNAPITMDTPMDPFQRPDGTTMTARDCVNIEAQLGYTYGPGSLDRLAVRTPQAASLAEAGTEPPSRTVHVDNLDRSRLPGSFLIALYGEIDGEKQLLDVDPVLSRWNVVGCANCQNHLNISSDFRIPQALAEGQVEVQVHTRAGVFGEAEPSLSAGFVPELAGRPELDFTVEIR